VAGPAGAIVVGIDSLNIDGVETGGPARWSPVAPCFRVEYRRGDPGADPCGEALWTWDVMAERMADGSYGRPPRASPASGLARTNRQP
jgi:hypothetical protein